VGSSSITLVLLAGSLLAGCYQRHAPWERAAPDGSAISMRVELGGGTIFTSGFLEVRFDGTYAASPRNELRVCTGTLEPAALDAWAELIERTGAFAREGLQGSARVTHAAGTAVELASEDGLATSFSFLGGPGLAGFLGWDPALAAFTDGAEDFWATLDLEACAIAPLDPATSSLRASIDHFDLRDEARRVAMVEVNTDSAVTAQVSSWWPLERVALEPCAPLAEADADRLWATVLASAPFTVSHPDGWREVRVGVGSEVTAADGTTHERRVDGWMQSSRPEQVALQDALVALVETHCAP
jgi:hypothetical protein